MNVNFDVFNHSEKPVIFLCNPNGKRIATISGLIYDTKLTLRFNALSEFLFTVPSTIDGGATSVDFYELVKVKRQVHIDGVGNFLINSVVEKTEGEFPRLEVECQSLECEMLSKKVNVLSGTFRLYNPIQTPSVPLTFSNGSSIISTPSSHNLSIGQAVRFSNINVSPFTSGKDYYVVFSSQASGTFSVSESPSGEAIVAQLVSSGAILTPSPRDSLLSYLLSLINLNVTENIASLGGWKVGGLISSEIASRYRTFDISDGTVYSVLMNDISTAYECIFIFDTINKEISVKSTSEATTNTTVFISYDNLITSSELKEMSDEIATALYVYGGDGVDIRSVNPTGSNILYNFDYYKNTDWMSQELIDSINNWEDKINTWSPTYFSYVENLMLYYDELGVLESEMSTLASQEGALEVALKAAIEVDSGVYAANYQLVSKQSEMLVKQGEIDTKNSQIDAVIKNLSSINISLDINNSSNFSEQQRVELSKYILENTWQNENILILDSFTPSQIQQSKLELYQQAKNVLEKVSVPRYEFSVESANFISLKEFQVFTNQIPKTLGAKIKIQPISSLPITAVLLEMSYSYDNPNDFNMVFSNRLRLDDSGFQYSDLMGQVVKTGASVSFDKPSWSNWSSNYKEDVTSFITSSLNATNNEIINSEEQEITIGEFGLRGRKSNGSGGYENNEIWLTSNVLAFTNDGWNSTKTAIGRINLGAGTYAYGLVADTIVGNLVASTNLRISNANNSFYVDERGATLTNAKLTIQSQLGGSGGIIIDPNSANVVSVGSISGGTIQSPSFKVDVSGNVTMNGNLYSGSNYIRTDGYAQIGGLVITPTSATFNGDIYANRLVGAVSYTQLTDIPANKITSGTMSGNRVSGGVLGGTIGLANGLISVYQSGSVSVIDATSSNTLRLVGSGGAYIWVGSNNITVAGGSVSIDGSVFMTDSVFMNGLKVATQSWVTSQGYYNSGDSVNFSSATISGVCRSNSGFNYNGNSGRSVTYTVSLSGGGTTTLRFLGGILVP